MELPALVPHGAIEEAGRFIQSAAVLTAAAVVLMALALAALVAVCVAVTARNPRLASLAARGAPVHTIPAPMATTGAGRHNRVPTIPSRVPDDLAITVAWRFHQALTAGIDIEDALELAEHPDVDMHQLAALVKCGCPTGVAARIVAPLDPQTPAP
ncbi:MAG TPA: hypothetical protein VE777_21920 [Gaiellales bacterium]|jgi:hypothetical protein|nr:hypothetical protein [Gaiellales bacterium]